MAAPERRDGIKGFHSVGSRSDLASWESVGILMAGIGRVGVIGATMVRGERGGEVGVGGEAVMAGAMVDMFVTEGREAERGLRESFRRQLRGVSIMVEV